MKYRSRMDIVAAILGIATDGAIKTKIMYSAFLSFPQLKEYLEMLIDAELLEYSSEQREYRTTQKGKHFLKVSKEVDQMIYKGSDQPRKTSATVT